MAKRKRRSGRKKTRQVEKLRTNYVKKIIKILERIVSISGHNPSKVYEDFLNLSEATLSQLPEQVKAVGKTGRFAADPPEIAERFERVRARYSGHWGGREYEQRVWHHFGEAFALLLESAEPGLWGTPNSLEAAGIFGPDVLGGIYQTWGMGSPDWNASFYTPFAVGKLMSAVTAGVDTERQGYDVVKKALLHPDNILGQSALLAGLVLPDDDPQTAWDYYLNTIVPLAMPYMEPIKVLEPAIGSGILVLSMAGEFPAWAVKRGIISFAGADTDLNAVRASNLNLMLYGLNGFHLKLMAAAAEALESWRQRTGDQLPAGSPAQIIRNVYRNGDARPSNNGNASSLFEQMFRTAAMRQPIEAS